MSLLEKYGKYLSKRDIRDISLLESIQQKSTQKQSIEPPFPIHPLQEQKILHPYREWLNSSRKRGLFLGLRKIGKTDLITIYETSCWLAENPTKTIIIMTRKQNRADMILRKIGENLKSIGKQGRFGSREIHLIENKSKQPNVVGTTINSSTKMYHADVLIMDDPVEPTDEYSRALKQRVDMIYEESKNIATKVFVIGQYVAVDDIYVKMTQYKNVDVFTCWIQDISQDLIDLLELDIEDFKQNMRVYGKNYEGVFYPDESSPFSNITMGSYGSDWNYGLIDPSNGKNDYSAIVYLKDFGNFVAIKGKMYKQDWVYAVKNEITEINKLDTFYWEENTIGYLGFDFFESNITCDHIRFTTTENKVHKILTILPLVSTKKIRLDDSSDQLFIDNIKNWNPKGGNNQLDDGIDALAMIIQRLGIFENIKLPQD